MNNLLNHGAEGSKTLLEFMNTTPVFDSKSVATPMTDAQVLSIKSTLFRDKRVNVAPNRFNSKVPYQVATRWTDSTTGETTWTNYGRFTNLDVAAFIGTIAGIAIYGNKALRGNFNSAKAQAHPECIAWLADDRNQEVILKAQENLASEGLKGA